MIANRAGQNSEVIFREVSQVTPDETLAKSLGIKTDDFLIKVEIVEAIDGIPTMYLVDYLSQNCGGVDDLSEFDGSVITYLVERCNPPLSHARTEIFAVGADEAVAAKLNIPEDRPIQFQAETYFSSAGEIIGMGFMYILTDQFHFFVNRRVV